MKKNSKIFIAGGSGMVGSAIIRKLSRLGYRNLISNYNSKRPGKNLFEEKSACRFVRLDLTRQKIAEDFFNKERPEIVFFAAARVGGIFANSTYKADFIYDNLMISTNVIHSAYRFGVEKLLNIGSSCIYPKFSEQPMKEKYLLSGILEPTNEPYAIAKISAIKLCKYYNEQYKTNFISLMPTNLYGPNDNFNLETSHVLPAMLRKFHLGKLLKEGNLEGVLKDFKTFEFGFDFSIHNALDVNKAIVELEKRGISDDHVTLWGTGRVFREFLHVDDFAEACVYIMKKYRHKDIGEFINVGTGKDLQLDTVAKIVKSIVKYDGLIRYNHTMPDGTQRKVLNINRIKKLGWRAKISLKKE